MKPSRGAPPVKPAARVAKKATSTKKATSSVFTSLSTSLPSLRIDPFLTKLAQKRLATGEGAEELEARLEQLGRYSAYQFLQEVMYSSCVAGDLRMDAAKQLLPYEQAKKAPVLEMGGGTVEDFARGIRASVKAIDDCIEQP